MPEARPAPFRGCGFGPCGNSIENGGKGCYLCDVIAKLPQPLTKAEKDLRRGERAEIKPTKKVAAEREKKLARLK